MTQEQAGALPKAQAVVDGWRRRAEAGDVEAMYDLGLYYATMAADVEEAARWLELASARDHRPAMRGLAHLYSETDEEPWERSEALLLRLADGSDPADDFWLADYYVNDACEWAEAAPYLQRAAAAGHVGAMSYLTFVVYKDQPYEARLWRQRAADAGHWLSAYRLAAEHFKAGDDVAGRAQLGKALTLDFAGVMLALADDSDDVAVREDLYRAAATNGADGRARVRLSQTLREAGKVDEADMWDAEQNQRDHDYFRGSDERRWEALTSGRPLWRQDADSG